MRKRLFNFVTRVHKNFPKGMRNLVQIGGKEFVEFLEFVEQEEILSSLNEPNKLNELK
jgi:hypothetical protein